MCQMVFCEGWWRCRLAESPTIGAPSRTGYHHELILFSATQPTQLPAMAPKKKPIGRPVDYSKSQMTKALNAVQDDDVSPYLAAQQHGVPKSTLLDQMKGSKASDEQIQPAQRLSRSQEEGIVTWILRQEKLGYAPTSSFVRSLVTSILKKNGDVRPFIPRLPDASDAVCIVHFP
jgi:hypothetical protein